MSQIHNVYLKIGSHHVTSSGYTKRVTGFLLEHTENLKEEVKKHPSQKHTTVSLIFFEMCKASQEATWEKSCVVCYGFLTLHRMMRTHQLGFLGSGGCCHLSGVFLTSRERFLRNGLP